MKLHIQRRVWLGIAIIFLGFIAAILVLKLAPKAAPLRVHATVTRIGPQPDAYHAMVKLTAQTPEGYVGYRLVALQNLRCNVGDRVDGQLRGKTLTIFERTCRRAP